MRVSVSGTSHLPSLLGLQEGEHVVGFALGKLPADEIPRKVSRRQVGFVKSLDYRPPTRDELLRHARVYPGDRQDVEEVAAMYGIELGVDFRQAVVKTTRSATAPKRAAANAGVSKHRRTNKQVVADVLALHDRGLLDSAIADSLNLSDRRVREILRR